MREPVILVLSPAVETLLLVVQTDELLDSGLPLEGVDAVHVINRNLASRRPEQALQRRRHLLGQLRAWVWPRIPKGGGGPWSR